MILEEFLPGAEVIQGDQVTYAYRDRILAIVVDAGDRPDGNAVRDADRLVVRAPFPPAAATWLTSPGQVFGFVRFRSGEHLPLGRLHHATANYRGGFHFDPGSANWRRAGATPDRLIWCEFSPPRPLADVRLDWVRPLPVGALPGIGWLDRLPADPAAAIRDFATGWYGPPGPGVLLGSPALPVPAPLAAYYELAATWPDLLGRHNRIFYPARLELDGSRLDFASENQGVWTAWLYPDEPDETVWVDQDTAEREPLSRYLVQFALTEAAWSAPFNLGSDEGVTAAEVHRVTGRMTPVPLLPSRIGADFSDLYVSPGLIAVHTYHGDWSWLWLGARHRSALTPFREPGFAWNPYVR